MREEEKVRREIEKAKREAETEEYRYAKALEQARAEMDRASGAQLVVLKEKMEALQAQLDEAHAKMERAVSRAQLTKSGHVYVISNIGSFGDGVVKIGLTRRLEPLDRVKELGDASVPFGFDVHAMIFSDNAPELEYTLHNIFDARRVNQVNRRKEFFRVSLGEIEKEVHKNNAEIEFTKLAEAKEYRETLATIEAEANRKTIEETIEDKFPAEL